MSRVLSRRRLGFGVGATLVGGGATAKNAARPRSTTVKPVNSVLTATVYPVRASSNGHYLVDSNNNPYLICGDSVPDMAIYATVADAAAFFDTRKAQGYNAVWMNVVPWGPPYQTYDGLAPFTVAGDLSTPNSAYFSRIDSMIALCTARGICCLLNPLPAPDNNAMAQANGGAKCFDYGVFLGNRWKNVPNIVWMHGNDYNIPSQTSVYDQYYTQIALGIKSVDANHIHTIEISHDGASPALSTDDPTWTPIISLSLAYPYAPVYDTVLRGYNLSPALPVFMGESWYENLNWTPPRFTPLDIRKEAWWSNLAGATGQLYGNDNVWYVGIGSDWKSHLSDPGSVHVGYMQTFLTAYPWQNLIPDQHHRILTAGYGTYATTGLTRDNNYVTCAGTADGGLVIAYVPNATTVTINMAKMNGAVVARWFDPTTKNTYRPVLGSPFANSGSHSFTTPGKNAYGDPDWTLVLSTHAPEIRPRPNSRLIRRHSA